jgi:hypothetical protein
MLSGSIRLAISSAAAVSLVALASATADAACPTPDHVDAALSMVGSATASGAPFFTLSQQMAYGYTNTQLFALWGSSSPSSNSYYNHILNANHFTRITTAADIQRGDVLVINSTGTYSGHTAIITAAASVISPQINPIYAATTQWAVPIVDATTAVHGCTSPYADSRCPSGTGAGTGTMRVYTDDTNSGALLGYTWSVTSSLTSYYAPNVRPYAIGRLTPCPP